MTTRFTRGDTLARKFRLPTVPSPWFLRDRLDQALTKAAEHRLTVVTGPPGAGKTVMLGAWSVRHSDRRVAYIQLDSLDNEPATFWRTVAAALHRFEHEPEANGDRSGPWSVVEITQRLPALVLVLDDFHQIKSPTILSDVELMIGNLAEHVHVVLMSREDPTIPLHRMRIEGDLAEIRQDDLRFEFGEAEAFLETMSARVLGADVARALVERTEGWAAGLQIAALLLRDDPDPEAVAHRFSGDSQVIAGYLTEEVLDTLPDKLYRFLMLTSVLDEMSAPLCRRVTGLKDASQILDELVSRHLFVIPIDPEHKWFRYHGLFSELLRHLLASRNPDAMRRAHFRAGDWFEAHGNLVAAVGHFVEAGALDRAFRLAADVVVDQLELIYNLDWPAPLIDCLPVKYLSDDPVRTFALAADRLVRARSLEGDMWLHKLTRSRPEPIAPWLESRIELLRALRAWLGADADGVLRHVGRGSSRRSEEVPAEILHEHSWLARLDASFDSFMSILAARAHLWLEDFDAVRKVLEELGPAPEPIGSVMAPGLLASAAARQGRLVESHHLATAAIDMGRTLGLSRSMTHTASHALSLVSLERDELDLAEQHIAAACKMVQDLGLDGWLAYAELDLVRILMAQRRPDEAFAIISRLRSREASGELPSHIRLSLDDLEIRWRLKVGDLDSAMNILERLPTMKKPPELEARAYLVAGRPDRAVAVLSESLEAHLPVNLLRETERLVLLALARLHLGSSRQARDVIRRALDLARPERLMRVFNEEGEEVRWLLQSFENRFPDPYLSDLIAYGPHRANGDGTAQVGPLAEILTERERATLTRLPSHLTQQQIAAEMYVSLNTLKTHLKSLYRKLGATTRAEAVSAARSHGLL